MATYQVKGPNGESYSIQGPDDADPSDVIAQVTGAHRYGTGKSYDATAAGVVPTGSAAAKDAQSPVSDSSVQNFLAGAGKATYDLGRGAGQWLGLTSRQDVADSRKRDAPLMNTKAGLAGDLTGTAVDLLPAALIPGAGTMAGAAAIGAGSGLLQPSTSTGETLGNTALGAAAGPASLAVGRGAGALYQGARAALEPLFQGGQERIAARTLQSFAGDPAAAAQAAQNVSRAPPVLPGVQPTTAELADNAGLSQLERTLRNNPEALTQLTARNQANRGAMTGALGQIAGTDADQAAAVAARTASSRPLYQAAGNVTVPADADLGRILARPSVQSAWARAAQLAAERGETLTGQNANDISGNTLQYLKMALQDTANAGPQRGMGSHELGAVRSTLGDLQDWITTNVPGLRAADQAYAAGSAPINRMQIGRELSDRLQPALTDFGNNSRLNANNFANAVRNGDQLAANVTGNSRATLAGTLTPDQSTTIRQIGEQLARRANADELGRAVGSNTGQNLASQNVLRQMLGPLGLPQGMSERAAQSTLGQTVMRPFQWAAQTGEPRVLQTLTRASLDPNYAANLLRRAPNSRAAQLLWQRQGLLGPLGNTAAQGLSGLMGSGNAPQQ
jgi:hypothetical protein